MRFLRTDHRQLQRLYQTDLLVKAALPHQTCGSSCSQRLRPPSQSCSSTYLHSYSKCLHMEASIKNLSQIPLLRLSYEEGGETLKTLLSSTDSVLSEYEFSISTPFSTPSPAPGSINGRSLLFRAPFAVKILTFALIHLTLTGCCSMGKNEH